MSLPNTYTDRNETGCCPVPNVDAWDEQAVGLEDRHFVRMYTRSFFFIPLNMGKIMKKLQETVDEADAALPAQECMILSRDISPWKAEQLYSVSHALGNQDNVTLNGMYLTKVFEGPYESVGKWYKIMQNYVLERGYKAKKTHFFYTTCPKCAKHYGKNYVISMAEVTS